MKNKNIIFLLVTLALGCGGTVESEDTGRADTNVLETIVVVDSHTTDTNVPLADSGSDSGTDVTEDTGTDASEDTDTGVAETDTGTDTGADAYVDPCTFSIWPPGSFLCPGHGSGGRINPDCVNILVNNDVLNCGACGHSCNGPGYSIASCVHGVCQCPIVDSTRALCNNTCVDMQIDDNNCRRCGNVCPEGVHCSVSRCNGI